MATYLLSSHDGFGLGHVRRNLLIARAVLSRDPGARITLVTGIERGPSWLRQPGVTLLAVPSLVKDEAGNYSNATLTYRDALAVRAERFEASVASLQPDVVLVDRHPFGVGGELRAGLELAHHQGAAMVLGLRDILDDAPAIWAELGSDRWRDAPELFDRTFVYGARHVCDHVAEYGLPVTPTYVGWVSDPSGAEVAPTPTDPNLVVICAGGGADGRHVRTVGSELVRISPAWHGIVVNGPLAEDGSDGVDHGGRLRVERMANGCQPLFERCGASVQMAGYNSTVEAVAAGLRPILVPRRAPRREQAIRAARFASLGIADVVDDSAGAEELAWLLNRPRRLAPGDLDRAGIDLTGAERTAERLLSLANRRRTALRAG